MQKVERLLVPATRAFYTSQANCRVSPEGVRALAVRRRGETELPPQRRAHGSWVSAADYVNSCTVGRKLQSISLTTLPGGIFDGLQALEEL